jgi:hypothetical protein
MRSLPTILLVLSLPAGAIGYLVGVRLLEAVLPDAAQGLVPFVALFIAGLVMLPFLIPFVDRKAKQDLAAYRASQPQDPDADPTPAASEVDR